jgi:hypothetical protein
MKKLSTVMADSLWLMSCYLPNLPQIHLRLTFHGDQALDSYIKQDIFAVANVGSTSTRVRQSVDA